MRADDQNLASNGSGRDDSVDWSDFSIRLKQTCQEAGFPIVGITDQTEAQRWEQLDEWLRKGHHGTMQYLEKRKEAYRSVESILPQCRSIIMLGMPYSKRYRSKDPAGIQDEVEPQREQQSRGYGKVARYAAGSVDYHDLIRERLRNISDWIRGEVPGCRVRGVVDTAPMLEREFAQVSGLGWIGKNTLLINRTLGSYFFLAAILVDLPLVPDLPWKTDHCGSCRACLDACPTQAFPEPRVLDATRCISYWTIENRDVVPESIQSSMGSWVFGCDVCQEVCPWNRKPEPIVLPELQATNEQGNLNIENMLSMSEEEFRQRFRSLPIYRTRWEGMLRNAAIVAGNGGFVECKEALTKLATQSDSERVKRTAEEALAKLSGS